MSVSPKKSPEEKAIDRQLEDLDRKKGDIFYAMRQKMLPVVPESGWFDPEDIKRVHKAIKPEIDAISAEMRTLRLAKKAARLVPPPPKPERPARPPEQHRGKCKDCGALYLFQGHQGIYTVRPSPSSGYEYVGIKCKKCGGTLARAAFLGSQRERSKWTDLDKPGANPADAKLNYTITSLETRDVMTKEAFSVEARIGRDLKEKWVGRIEVFRVRDYPHGKMFWIPGVVVRSKYKGKGIGIRLYVEAVRHVAALGGKLMSKPWGRISEDAKNLRRALPKYLHIETVPYSGGDVDVYSPKRNPVDPTTHRGQHSLAKREKLLKFAEEAGVLGQVEKKYRVDLSEQSLIDCGGDACGWAYGDYVFKITESADDASASIALLDMRRKGLPEEIKNGLVKIHEVCSPKKGGRIWIIVGEMLRPLTDQEFDAMRAFNHSRNEFCRSGQRGYDLFESRYGRDTGLVDGVPREVADRAWRAYRALVLLEKDYRVTLWTDAHAGNWGTDPAGNIKLFDFGSSGFPGYTAPPDECAWGCDAVAQNPGPSRREPKLPGLHPSLVRAMELDLVREIEGAGLVYHSRTHAQHFVDSLMNTLLSPKRPMAIRNALQYDGGNLMSFFQPEAKERVRLRLHMLADAALRRNLITEIPFNLEPPATVGERDAARAARAEVAKEAAKAEKARLLAELKVERELRAMTAKRPRTEKAAAKKRAQLLEIGHGPEPIEKSLPEPVLGIETEEGEPHLFADALSRREATAEIYRGAKAIEHGEPTPANRFDRIAHAQMILEDWGEKGIAKKVKDRESIYEAANRFTYSPNKAPMVKALRELADEIGELDRWQPTEQEQIARRASMIEVNPGATERARIGRTGSPWTQSKEEARQRLEWEAYKKAHRGAKEKPPTPKPKKPAFDPFAVGPQKLYAPTTRTPPLTASPRSMGFILGAEDPDVQHNWIRELVKGDWIKKTERKAGVTLGRMHGCGAFGCAFEIVAPADMTHYVVKFTIDPTEGANQNFVGRRQRIADKTPDAKPLGKLCGLTAAEKKISSPLNRWMSEGFTTVHSILTLKDTIYVSRDEYGLFKEGHHEVFITIREDISTDLDNWRFAVGRTKKALLDFGYHLTKYREAARSYNLRYKGKVKCADVKWETDQAAFHLEKIRAFSPSVGNGMEAWFKLSGAMLADAHIGNIGARTHPEFGTVGDLVIFDPGYTFSEKAMSFKGDIEVVRNPALTR